MKIVWALWGDMVGCACFHSLNLQLASFGVHTPCVCKHTHIAVPWYPSCLHCNICVVALAVQQLAGPMPQ